MSKPFSIEKPVLLLGEGREEELFFFALVKHLKLADSIQVIAYKGKDKLAKFLADLRTQTDFPKLRAIGITRDADNDPAAARASTRSAIQSARFQDTLRVETFILPKENAEGALEALVLEAVKDTPAWPCVEAFSKCVEEKAGVSFSVTGHDKHHVQAWLSTLPSPDLRFLGLAAQKGHISFDHPAFQPVIDFIQSLVSASDSPS
ncbi:MAG: hypothetical protein LBW77_03380 [Verrucomicrobiota bacterium]|jgi:hypothetical protein|nr:hypothetical protein [Verrucomicrobiota bacterium]